MASDKPLKLIATCAKGTERPLRFELESFGVTELTTGGAGVVEGKAAPEAFARANIGSRIASKILLEVASFKADSEKAFYDAVRLRPTEEWFPKGATLAIETHLKNAALTHSHYAALKMKDAIVDRFRDRGLGRPEIDPKTPEARLVVHWENDTVKVAIDTSGKPLFKRGYRAPGGEAPMKETLAAAILSIGHADVRRPFIDPCCGTGTLAIEQAWRSLNRAPGRDRRFAMDRWRKDPWGLAEHLEAAREQARDEERDDFGAPIFLSDWHPKAVQLAEESIQSAGLEGRLVVERVDARKARIPEDHPVICTNLPFGERLKGKGNLQLDGFYRTLGERMRSVPGARVIVFTAHEYGERLLDLPDVRRWSLYSGPLKARLLRSDIPDLDGAPDDHRDRTPD